MKRKLLIFILLINAFLVSAIELDTGIPIFNQLLDKKIGVIRIVEYPEETPPVYCLIFGEQLNKQTNIYYRVYALDKELLISKAIDIKTNYDSAFIDLKKAIDTDSRITEVQDSKSAIEDGIIYKYYYYVMK